MCVVCGGGGGEGGKGGETLQGGNNLFKHSSMNGIS